MEKHVHMSKVSLENLFFYVHKQTCILLLLLLIPDPTTDPQLKIQSFTNFLTIYSNFCFEKKSDRESLRIVVSKLVVGFSEQYGRIFDELLSSLSIKTGNNYCAMV
jgi:hypothetical protein